MKKQFIYPILSLFILSACSTIDDVVPVSQKQERPENALQISVNANDFTVDGKTTTRANDNGKETVFEDGDKVGLIILENGVPIAINNLPYVYSGKEWNFDEAVAEDEGTGKSLYYSNAAVSSVTYIVYYPYSSKADNAKSIDELKACFEWSSDQSAENIYRNADLMVWTKTGAPISKLDATMSHVYSAFSLSLSINCTLDDEASTEFSFTNPDIYDVNISVGNHLIKPFYAEDGSYRCILPNEYSGDVRWFYVSDDETYAGTKTIAGAANTRYSQVETIQWKYSFDKAQIGDFYCVTGNKGYLVPKVASNEFLKTVDCIGVVFYVGDVTGDNYGLLDNKFSHGLVAALWEGVDPANENTDKMAWDYGTSESVSSWLAAATWADSSKPSGFTTIKGNTKAQGYANTFALRKYNINVGDDSPKRNKIVESLDKFTIAHPLASNSSEWYCPSEYEAKNLYFGQGLGTGSVGRNNFNQQVAKYKEAKSTGVLIENRVDYWTSTEVGNSNVININYQDSGWYGTSGSPKNKQYKHRPILAF